MNDHDKKELQYLLNQVTNEGHSKFQAAHHFSVAQSIKHLPWYANEPPAHANTPRVLRVVVIGALLVTIAAFVTAPDVPNALFIIPLYLVHAAIVLIVRQMRLATK